MFTSFYLTDTAAIALIKSAARFAGKGNKDVVVVYHDDKPFFYVNGVVSDVPNGEGAVPVYKVDVNNVDMVVGGWEYVGKISRRGIVGGRNLVFAKKGFTVPAEFYTADLDCCHCGQNRKRLDTYILRNVDGRVVQIGTACVAAYIGNDSFAAYCERLSKLLERGEELENESREARGGSYCKMYNRRTILDIALGVIAEKGYISQSRSNAYCQSTADIVKEILTDYDMDEAEPDIVEKSEVPFIDKAIEWAMSLSPRNDYEQNLKTIAGSSAIGWRNIALLVSLIPSYEKATAIAKQNADKPDSQFVGVVGEKLTAVVTCRKIVSFRTNFTYRGETSFVVIMEDGNGNNIVWKTAKQDHTVVYEGNKFEIVGTVKEHTDYKGRKQTSLTRCKTKAL